MFTSQSKQFPQVCVAMLTGKSNPNLDIYPRRVRTRDGRFGSKVGQIGPIWDKSGAFSDQISVHLAQGRQMHWNMIWKAPDLSHFGPIWPTLEPNLPSLVRETISNYYLNCVHCGWLARLWRLSIKQLNRTLLGNGAWKEFHNYKQKTCITYCFFLIHLLRAWTRQMIYTSDGFYSLKSYNMNK